MVAIRKSELPERIDEIMVKEHILSEEDGIEDIKFVSECFWIVLRELGFKGEKRDKFIDYLNSEKGRLKLKQFLINLSDQPLRFQIRALLRSLEIANTVEEGYEEMFFDKPTDDQMLEMKDAFERALDLYMETKDTSPHLEYIKSNWMEWFDLMKIEGSSLDNYFLLRMYLEGQIQGKFADSFADNVEEVLSLGDLDNKDVRGEKSFDDEYLIGLNISRIQKEEANGITDPVVEGSIIIDSVVGCDRFNFAPSARLTQLDRSGRRCIVRDGIMKNIAVSVDDPREVIKRKLRLYINEESDLTGDSRGDRITARGIEAERVESEREIGRIKEEFRRRLEQIEAERRAAVQKVLELNEVDRESKVARFSSRVDSEQGKDLPQTISQIMDFDYNSLLGSKLPSAETIAELDKSILMFLQYISRSGIIEAVNDSKTLMTESEDMVKETNSAFKRRPSFISSYRRKVHYDAIRRRMKVILIKNFGLVSLAKEECFSGLAKELSLFSHFDDIFNMSLNEFYSFRVKDIIRENEDGLAIFLNALSSDESLIKEIYDSLIKKLGDMWIVAETLVGRYEDLFDETAEAIYSPKSDGDFRKNGLELIGLIVNLRRKTLKLVENFNAKL